MNYILAIDQGTSSTRAMIYTLQGDLIANSQYPLTQYYPNLGWVEHDPEEIWQKTLNAMRDVVSQVQGKAILCCGLTNQRETTLIWNKKQGNASRQLLCGKIDVRKSFVIPCLNTHQ